MKSLPDHTPQIILDLMKQYELDWLPVEGTFYKSTYRSEAEMPEGGPVGTAMIGLYSTVPDSHSCFHVLTRDEVWHFYDGDPLELILLYPDGTGQKIQMGKNHTLQFVIPAGTAQAGHVKEGGTYSLFGCTVVPGFTGDCFKACTKEELRKSHPQFKEEIEKFALEGEETKMPEGFAQ